jgi:hypothetical protein
VIPSPLEIARAIYGAWRLAHLDKGGMNFFDRSIEGFWKSFFAAVIVVPGYVLLIVIDLSQLELSASPLRILVVQLLIYVIVWVAFPLVMYAWTQNMGRAAAYPGFIVAYNWAQVVQMLLVLPVGVVVASHLLPAAVVPPVNLAVLVVLLGYEWFIARTALAISGMAAVGVVGLSFFIGLIAKLLGLSMIS